MTHLVLNDELQELSGRQGADPFDLQRRPRSTRICMCVYIYIYIHICIYIYCIMSNM